jgi:hypothetical protein
MQTDLDRDQHPTSSTTYKTKTKQNKTKQNKTKQNKTKQSKTKQKQRPQVFLKKVLRISCRMNSLPRDLLAGRDSST